MTKEEYNSLWNRQNADPTMGASSATLPKSNIPQAQASLLTTVDPAPKPIEDSGKGTGSARTIGDAVVPSQDATYTPPEGANYRPGTGGGTAKKAEEPLVPAAEMWQSGYTPSQNVADAMAYLQQQEAAIANRGPYDGSPYDQDIADAYSRIMGRGPFHYQVNDDALYQMYRDLYAENGRQASLNAQGQAAGLTGGYGNSYAAAAGNAAYDQYMTQLNDRALDLYDRAYQRWLDEGEQLQEQLGTARAMGDQDYSRWVDDYNRALAERDYAYGKYGDEWQRDYGVYNNTQQLAYQQAIAMIQAGVTPSAQMRRNAGISDEDYANLKQVYKKRTTGGGAPKDLGPTRPDTGLGGLTPEQAPAASSDPVEQVYDYINAQVNSKNMTPEQAYAMIDAMNGNTKAGSSSGATQTVPQMTEKQRQQQIANTVVPEYWNWAKQYW